MKTTLVLLLLLLAVIFAGAAAALGATPTAARLTNVALACLSGAFLVDKLPIAS